MTATILLIRHAAHADLGHRLTGRMDGVALTPAGEAQAARLADYLDGEPLAAVQASPALRARQTATALTHGRDVAATTQDALLEVDFGEWTGRTFAELEKESGWQDWNTRRGSARVPGGESMGEVQQRAWRHIVKMALDHEGGTVAMVSHCDWIRATIAQALGLPLDHLLRFDIEPASISRLVVGDWGARVMSMNERAA